MGGFLVGYAIKKFIKLLAAIFGAFILVLAYLDHVGVITLNYEALKSYLSGAGSHLASAFGSLLEGGADFGTHWAASHLTLFSSFTLGLIIGLKKG